MQGKDPALTLDRVYATPNLGDRLLHVLLVRKPHDMFFEVFERRLAGVHEQRQDLDVDLFL